MSQIIRFKAVIEMSSRGGTFVTIPFDVENSFGKKRVKVLATFDGESYRGSLVRMGGTNHIIGVLKEIREKTGKGIGDEIEVTVMEDIEPRVIAIPPDLQAALDSCDGVNKNFLRLSFTHRKEYVQWIEDARRERTRRDRIAKIIDQLGGSSATPTE